MSDLTILFGANDVGKSRLLRTIADGTASLDSLARGEAFAGDHRFFVKLHPDDAKLLLQRAYRLHLDQLQTTGNAGETEDLNTENELPWLAFVPAEARDLDPRHSTFALEALAEWCGRPSPGAPGLLVSWCEKAEPLAADHSFSTRDRSVRMGTIDVPVLPLPVELPVSDPSWLRRDLTDAIAGWLAHVEWGLRSVSGLERLTTETDHDDIVQSWWDLVNTFSATVDSRPPLGALWTVEDSVDGSVAYRPLARSACRFVGEIATRLAPAFVRDRYALCVAPVPILAWRDEEPLQLLVTARNAERTYDSAEVADGLKVWIQIALLEAADAMRRVELNLRNALLAVESEVNKSVDKRSTADAQARSDAIRAYLSQLDEATKQPIDPPFERSLGATFALAPGMEWPSRDEHEPTSEVARRVAPARPRLYLLDEPERHLNPRLQRAAATWLAELLLTRGSQGVIATHASAFLSVGSGPAFVEVRRESDASSRLLPFEPHELTAYSQIAKEVGLDRGELLSSVRLLAFVEGRHDRAVLEELFRSPLYHAGVVVVPIAGVGRHAQIIEHDVLVRFTNARLAVVFDKLDRETIDRLLSDTDFRLESLRARPTELQAMASLLHNAIANGRNVRPLPMPVDDIFDALDEQILVDQFPDFPGHADANAAWETDRKRIPNRKIFYQERYGIPNATETYTRIASLMRSFDRIPPTLRDLGMDLERMAAEAG